MTDRRAIPVFRAGGREFTVGEVLDTAPTASLPRTADAEVDDAALEAAIADYRYARELVSAEECESWLARRGLGYADLVAHLRRRLARADGTHGECEPADALIDALLDPAFDGHAREFARLAALACESGESLGGVDVAAAWPRWRALADLHLLARIDGGDRRRELEHHAADWTRLRFLLVEFDDAAAAREARACVVHDGEDLAELAAAQGFSAGEHDTQAGDLPRPIAGALAHAPVGALQAAQLEDGRHCLLRLASRTPPHLSDPAIAARIESALRARLLDTLVCRHVHWILPLHHG